MKNYFILLILLVYSSILLGQNSRKVLIVGIDGCRPDALAVANTPNLDQLISNGIYSPHALNDDITISGPGWSAILCGVWSEKHLVTNNDFSGNNYDEYPSIFHYVNEYDPGFHTISICHWNPINDFIIADDADFKLNVATDAEVGQQAAAYLSLNDPDLVFLHFDDPDIAGHSQGFSPDIPAYIAAIEGVDNYLGPVLDAIANRPNYDTEDWLILVTTDHGGIGTSHGGNTIEEETVIFIASGNNVENELILRDSAVVFDTPENCLGDSLWLQFDGDNDYVDISTNPVFNFGASQDFSVECRVRTNQSADVAIVGNKDWDSGINKGFVFSFKFPSGPEWKINIGDGSTRADINSGGQIADNEWHTLSASFDRNGLMRMYQDGEIIDSADISFIGDIDTDQGLFFGTDINSAYDYTGAIAEVRVWNGLLTAENISDWHCQSLTPEHPQYDGLIGHWKLTEGIGTDVFDQGPNNLNGNIVDAQWSSPDSVTIYDYSNTPRITDIATTALNHLCIPIQEDWDLDGETVTPVCMITSTIDPTVSAFIIQPNPGSTQVHIQWDPDLKVDDIEIFNARGQIIYHKMLSQEQIGLELDVQNFPVGLYFIRLESEEQSIVKKFIKN